MQGGSANIQDPANSSPEFDQDQAIFEADKRAVYKSVESHPKIVAPHSQIGVLLQTPVVPFASAVVRKVRASHAVCRERQLGEL